jgi:hypothetical protein
MKNVYKILVGKPDGKRPLIRHRCRWEDNIKWILGTLGGKVWTGFIWLRIGTSGWDLVNLVTNLRVP